MKQLTLVVATWLCGILLFSPPSSARAATFEQGDRVTLIGNLLAERMQHDGWLETLVQSRLPQHQLVFRNLGFSGDELDLRQRSADFGTPDEWLTKLETDVVLAFFGYNESFAGEAGLEQFRADLNEFIEHTKAAQYNGQSAPRLVLFSPIAFEDLDDPNLPDGAEHNRRLEAYTQAIQEAAQQHDVTFVDLFNPMLEAYRSNQQPLTINGHFLDVQGNRVVAQIIAEALLDDAPQANTAALEKLREAVVDKNFYWFHRYRTTDGYNVYGGRSSLRFTDNQTNYEVMQREMEVLDALTANRDHRIWAIAQGGDLEIDDSNTPPFIPVETNKPGPLPGGKHRFLGGEESISRMTVAEGMRVELVASEEQFPELINPVQMAFDPKGRLWVAAWESYPHWKPKDPMNDKLLILVDSDGDGRADQCKTFADGLHNPTGFEFWNGGVLVAMVPDLLFLKDTDGDDVADVRQRVLHGIDSADTHHSANSFVIDPGGALYFQEGTFHQSQIETLYDGSLRCNNACIWRFDPRTWDVDRYIPFDFANPHGHVIDRWGQGFVHDGTGSDPFHATLFSGHLDFPQKHPRPPMLYQRRTRPCPATEILSSEHFPEELQGNLLVGNVIGFQGILQYRFEDRDASFTGIEADPIVSSSDENFRPVDLEIGPDGALYFTDWQNSIIGHMQHHIRDPNRDQEHGRVYRVVYEGRSLLEPPQIAGAPIEGLLELLKNPGDRVRYRTRLELSGRDTQEIVAAAKEWIELLDPQAEEYEHHLLEGLWLHQQHNVVNEPLLRRMLDSPDFRARAAATRVLCYWRDRVSDSLGLLKELAADSHPRVRLEAIRAASFYTAADAIEVPIISMEFPTDEYIDFTRGQTMKALEPHWKKALAEGHQIEVTSDAGMRYLIANVTTDELLKMTRDEFVYRELLFRNGVMDEQRREALAGLARLENKSELRVLLDAISSLGESQQGESVVYDLVRMLTTRSAQELASVRDELKTMATSGNLPVIRQIGYVALITADGDAQPAWELATESVARLRDFVDAMPLVPDPNIRASLYPRIAPLLTELPENLASSEKTSGAYGRYIRIELPGRRRTLTLAEVEVFSGGRNVAPQGKASQSSTAFGGPAQRAIDGNKSGQYSDGGQTHTAESRRNPWWELDLGEAMPIESVSVYNRTDGNFGRRLEEYTIRVLDDSREQVFLQEELPVPDPQATVQVGGGGPEGIIRRSAMNALTYVRGKEQETFERLAPFVQEDVDRLAAVRAIQRIGRQHWPAAQAPALLESVIAYVREIPVNERTSPAALDALQLGDTLASLLPADAARAARSQLGELGVRVLRVGTLPHRMAYDQERMAVGAGKSVEFIFENTDLMPHNFVITLPGTLEEVGLLGEATAQAPDAAERQYVPRSDQILLASRLLQPREVQKLSFEAPTEPGVYPYVCTYPGHWRRMYGALYVVADLDGYLADPEGYLASNPLPIRDKLLEFNRPRTEWTFQDLAASVEMMADSRSFANGKQIFEVASCAACHKLNGAGVEVGPDLAKLDPMFTPLDILQELIDPSKRINEDFQSFTFALSSGQVVTGLVVEETPEAVKVIENPLAKSEPLVIPTDEIEQRAKATTSIMPEGLLDKLTHEEILDLIAYIAARGSEQHSLFTVGEGQQHEHHHH